MCRLQSSASEMWSAMTRKVWLAAIYVGDFVLYRASPAFLPRYPVPTTTWTSSAGEFEEITFCWIKHCSETLTKRPTLDHAQAPLPPPHRSEKPIPPFPSPHVPHIAYTTCCRTQSGALLIEGAKLGLSGGASFSLSTSGASVPSNGVRGRRARACDFWGGLRREGVGDGEASSERWGGGDGGYTGGFDNDDDSDGGGGDFAGGGGPDDDGVWPREADGAQVRRWGNRIGWRRAFVLRLVCDVLVAGVVRGLF